MKSILNKRMFCHIRKSVSLTKQLFTRVREHLNTVFSGFSKSEVGTFARMTFFQNCIFKELVPLPVGVTTARNDHQKFIM